MSSANNEKLYERLGEDSECAKLLLLSNPEPSREYLEELSRGGKPRPQDFSSVTMTRRMKHTLAHLVQFLEATYPLQYKLNLNKTGARSDEDAYMLLTNSGAIGDKEWNVDDVKTVAWVKALTEEATKEENRKHRYTVPDGNKINKTDINHVRSYYRDQILKVFPRLVSNLYDSLKSSRSSFTYNTNEIRAVKVEKEFVESITESAIDILRDHYADGSISGFKNFIEENWFSYKAASGRNAQKIAPFAEKLISVVIACIGRYDASVKNTLSSNEIPKDKADEILAEQEEVTHLVYNIIRQLGYQSDPEAKEETLTDIRQEALKKTLLESFKNPKDRVFTILSLAVAATSVRCNTYLVHLNTILDRFGDQYEKLAAAYGNKTFNAKSVSDIRNMSVDTAMKKFPDEISIDDVASAAGSLIHGKDMYASARLITVCFKAMNVSYQSQDPSSRKTFPEGIEEKIVKVFGLRLAEANKEGKKDKSIILSDEMYRSIKDKDLREAFSDAHSDADFGYVQKFVMWVTSATNVLHNGKVVRASEELDAEICEAVNTITYAVSLYSMEQDSTVKDLKKAAKKKKTADSKKEEEAKKGARSGARSSTRAGASPARDISSPERGTRAQSPQPALKRGTQHSEPASKSFASPARKPSGLGLKKLGGARTAPAPTEEEPAAVASPNRARVPAKLTLGGKKGGASGNRAPAHVEETLDEDEF